MALSSKDGLWDRNFQSFEQEELDHDTKLDDEIKIAWTDLSGLKRRTVDTVIIANDKSCHLFNVLLKHKYHKLASITYANYKVNVITSQRGIAQPVTIYSNKDPRKANQVSLAQLGGAAVSMAQTGQLGDSEANKKEIIFVYAPNVPNAYHYCISEFITLHFGPNKVICLDTMSRGNFVQNYDELEMPQLRKLCTSTAYNANQEQQEEKKQDLDEEDGFAKMSLVDSVQYLETGNLITSLSAAMLQQCEYTGIKGYLFVSIFDLDYLTEALMSFGNILLDVIPSSLSEILECKNVSKLQSMVRQRCAKYANKNGYLLTGREMFG
eukprot:CAMPEP_0197044280 /NCGR_PEP_ID=MMETSP1384-20130603/20373_1 /TAXON_ID=29189 /ORGANISM="Ammonia sp." /LENGTH=323 /DNA_ID=CAMNT_0042475711 /DNA_START=47 /DNA_END=1018 /DNA_ORIENTATION=-